MSTTLIQSVQSYTDHGKLQIQLVSQIQNRPVQGAKISISYTGAPGQPLEQLRTNSSGQTETIELAAPPVEYSLQPSEEQPYSEYTLKVEAEGYEPIEVSGSEILSGEISRQKIKLRPISDGNYEDVVIPDHTLFGNYPEKIPEEEVKPVNESGEIVLSRVVIPEYVVVHDGSPADSTADNYYVRYRDYIKNVACSEIYATWHDQGECSGNHVFYSEPGLYGVVQKQTVRLYHYILHCLRSQMDIRSQYFRQYIQHSG